MMYEEEQIKYAEELKQVNKIIKRFDELFKDPNYTNAKILELYKKLNPLDVICIKNKSLSEFEFRQRVSAFRQMLEDELRKQRGKKKELERLLSQTPAERKKDKIENNIGKTVEFVASITPQHVSGRTYRVENGDGCGTFCLWFMIIDAIICFIVYLCTK